MMRSHRKVRKLAVITIDAGQTSVRFELRDGRLYSRADEMGRAASLRSAMLATVAGHRHQGESTDAVPDGREWWPTDGDDGVWETSIFDS
jgi:hypothetical protein